VARAGWQKAGSTQSDLPGRCPGRHPDHAPLPHIQVSGSQVRALGQVRGRGRRPPAAPAAAVPGGAPRTTTLRPVSSGRAGTSSRGRATAWAC